MSGEAVRVERNGAVWTVILHRPEARNAVDRPTADALVAAFLEFENDPTASVAVLYGDGGTFCAGADLKAIMHGRGNRMVPPHQGGDLDAEGPMGPSRLTLTKPVIAAVAGFAVAGGLELAIWCDLRVAEEDATFGIFCRRWGVPLVDGGTVRLPRLIGQSRAMDMILTGRAVGAREALEMGLANRVVPKGQARAAAEKLAAEIAALPQACMRNDRMSSLQQWGLGHDAAMANEYVFAGKSLASPEIVSGVGRFTAGAGRGGKSDGV